MAGVFKILNRRNPILVVVGIVMVLPFVFTAPIVFASPKLALFQRGIFCGCALLATLLAAILVVEGLNRKVCLVNKFRYSYFRDNPLFPWRRDRMGGPLSGLRIQAVPRVQRSGASHLYSMTILANRHGLQLREAEFVSLLGRLGKIPA